MEQHPIGDDGHRDVQLTVADGFRFGCGFVLAVVAFWFAVIILVALVFLLAKSLGVTIPLGSLFNGL